MSLREANSPPPQLELGGLMTADAATLIEHLDAEGMPPEFRWPKTLAKLYDVADATAARRTRVSEVERYDLVRDLVIAIATYLGGRMVYLPTGDTLRLAIRDRQLWARYLHGATPDELMSECGLNQRQLYDVLAQQRKLFEARYQPQLLPAAPQS